jgi:hypothetical protein
MVMIKLGGLFGIKGPLEVRRFAGSGMWYIIGYRPASAILYQNKIIRVTRDWA